jgi:hypothetical protein
MPGLGFYAAAEDFLPVLEIAFEDCRVFESYSVPEEPLRSYWNPVQVRNEFERRGDVFGLELYSPSMKGPFTIERFALDPVTGHSWRETIGGYLISLDFRSLQDGRLPPSLTNHLSERGARARARVSDLPAIDSWDFREIARISRRINRRIASLAVGKSGSQPILPGADALVKSGAAVLTLG